VATGKLKCKHCRDWFDRFGMIQTRVGRFCSTEHQIQWAIANKAKGRKKIEQSERKITIAAKKNNLKTRKDAAKKACHDYIRARDSGKGCICCNKPLGNNFHAGHWLESGNNPQIRYDEDNIHGQRLDCNFFKGGDSGDYQENLIIKIGLDRVNKLKNLTGGTVKRSPDEYKIIEKYYKNKLEELKRL